MVRWCLRDWEKYNVRDGGNQNVESWYSALQLLQRVQIIRKVILHLVVTKINAFYIYSNEITVVERLAMLQSRLIEPLMHQASPMWHRPSDSSHTIRTGGLRSPS